MSSPASSIPASKAKSQPLLRTYLPGDTLSSLQPSLTESQISQINYDLGTLVANLSLYAPSNQTNRFGPVVQVSSSQGYKTWHDAFLSMMDSTLRDAEDVLVSLPYGAINEQISRFASSLESVTTPRLVLPNLADGDAVVLSDETEGKSARSVKGVADVSAALWADIGFADLWNDGFMSKEVWAGFKQALLNSDDSQSKQDIESLRHEIFEGDGARRQLLYKLYRSIATIVSGYYRARTASHHRSSREPSPSGCGGPNDEMKARRALTATLSKMSEMNVRKM